jgi:hypothetical protein
MSTGTISSGIGHGALIVWLLLGDWLFSPPEPEELTAISTSMVTEAEFEAMQAAAASTPEPAEVPAVEAPPETPPPVEQPPVEQPPVEQPPETPPPETPPPVVDQPPVVEQPPVDQPPEIVPGPTAPDVDASDLPAAVELQPLESSAPSIRPKPRPAQVVSTEPTVSEEDAPTTAEPVEATAPAETADPVEPVEPTEPVEEQNTGDTIVTEATTEQEEPLGLTSSPRPPRKPPVPTETEIAAEVPAEEPADEPATETATETAATEDPMTDILNEVVDEGAATDGGNTAPQGPPMTQGEKDGLLLAINDCWSTATLSTEALFVTVTVYVSLDRDGKPIPSSIEMAGFEGGSEAAARKGYEAGRRAIIICGKNGYDLPPEKYEEWKDLGLIFDPNGMRLR